MTDGVPENLLFRFLEEPGPFAVGFQVIEQYDHSRVFRHATDAMGRPDCGNRSRPIQTLLWYPAQASKARRMAVADYVLLATGEIDFGNRRMTRRATEWLSGMKPTLAQQMWAVRDMTPLAGCFPVLVYAPGYAGPAWENADLCEYLASQGYIVIASPSLGAMTRSMTSDVEGVEAQARDISFLISYACTLPNADIAALAVAGFSWGGLSNLFAAARDTRIKALIALDGSMRYWSSLIKQASYVRPEEMVIPLIYFAQGSLSVEDQARYLQHNDGPNVLNAWIHGDLTTVDMPGMCHTDYSSMFQRNEAVWWQLANVHQQKSGRFGRSDGTTGYAWMARYTCEFLNAYLKRDPVALDFLKRTPAQNGVPRDVNVNHRPASGHVATLDAFRKEVARAGFEHIETVWAVFKKASPQFQLQEEALSDWAEELLNTDHLVPAVAVLTFNTRIRPDCSSAHVRLGEALEGSGKIEEAIASYRRALEQDTRDSDAAWKLELLSRRSAP